jgi:hypothetical protein
MKRFVLAIALFVALRGMGFAQSNAQAPPVFVIHGPTILAFFHPMTQAEAESGEGDAEALNDFDFYADKVEGPLKKAGVDFREVDVRVFRVRDGKTARRFRTGPIGIGYYFIAPGKEPHIEYGVMTDLDMLAAAHKYFGTAMR